LKKVICYAEKEQLLLEVTVNSCIFPHKIVWWEQCREKMQATAKKQACEVKLEFALMRTF